MSVGQRLRRIREGQGMTFATLAKRSGMAKSQVFQIERDSSSPTVTTLERLANALGCTVGQIVDPEAPAISQPRLQWRKGHSVTVREDGWVKFAVEAGMVETNIWIPPDSWQRIVEWVTAHVGETDLDQLYDLSEV